MPLISILVPVRQARTTIVQTIHSLLAQCEGSSVEVILAISQGDSSLTGKAFDRAVRVVIVDAPAGVPQLRRAAALVASGDLLVITEDHCTFPTGWLSGLALASARHPGSVCGGPVDNGRLTPVGWAQYFTRYAAFFPVGRDRTGKSLPGNNACYPRTMVESRWALLREGFWEAELNRELAASGVPFVMLQSLAIRQHQNRGAVEYIGLRFRHGRCYGARRFLKLQANERSRLIVGGPLLPALLYWRILRSVLRSRWNRAEFLIASPLILLYVLAWSAGEIAGYLTGAGSSCTQTD